MTQISQSYQDFKNAGWTCIHFDHSKVLDLRTDHSYFEFFETAHIRNLYAIFSVPNGHDFFFYNEADATEFLLRWA
jgi:hypothetical protein